MAESARGSMRRDFRIRRGSSQSGSVLSRAGWLRNIPDAPAAEPRLLTAEAEQRLVGHDWQGNVRENENPVCQIHMMDPRTPVIGPEGNVYACTNINHVFGNMLEKPLAEIWDSEQMRAMRRGMVKDKLLPLCKRCPCVDII